MKKLILQLGFLAVLILCFSSLYSCSNKEKEVTELYQDLSEHDKKAIEKAYQDSLKAIDKRAKELDDWYDSKRENIPDVVYHLTNLKSKWEYVTGGDMEERTENLISMFLFNPSKCEHQALERMKALQIEDYLAIEDELSIASECSEILTESRAKVKLMKEATTINEATAILRTQFIKEAGVFVASEAAAAIAGYVITSAASSAGILTAGAATSSVTFGISLAVGVVISVVVDMVVDPSEELTESLNDLITSTSTEQVKAFKDVAIASLEERKKQWIITIAKK